jgi:hypothetical protein
MCLAGNKEIRKRYLLVTLTQGPRRDPGRQHTHTPSRVKKQHDNTARIYTRIVDIERWRSRGGKRKKTKQERSRGE